MDDLITRSQAAIEFQIPESTLEYWQRAGLGALGGEKLPAYRQGVRVMVRRSDVARFVAARNAIVPIDPQ